MSTRSTQRGGGGRDRAGGRRRSFGQDGSQARPQHTTGPTHRPEPGDAGGTSDTAERDHDPPGEDIPELVQRAQCGEAVAFADLYRLYHPEILDYLRRRVGHDELAQDLASDTFVRAWSALGSFTWQGRSLVAWLVTIAGNLARDHWKSSRTRHEVLDPGHADWTITDRRPEAHPAETVLARLDLAEVRRALPRLSHDARACLLARFVDELSIAETATRLGKSPTAVKVTQHRALSKLRTHLSHHLPPAG